MKISRLTTVVSIIRHWPFFLEGFEGIQRKSRETLDTDQMQKTLYLLSKSHQAAWIGVASDESGPVGFAVFEDATPNYSPVRSCLARAIYHKPGVLALVPLLEEFELWAKEQGYQHYVVATRRHSGSAVRHYESPKFGFKRGYITFEKAIT